MPTKITEPAESTVRPTAEPISEICLAYTVFPSGSSFIISEPFAMYVLPAASTASKAAAILFSYTRWAAGRLMASGKAETHARGTRNRMPESEQFRFHDKSFVLCLGRDVGVAERHGSG